MFDNFFAYKKIFVHNFKQKSNSHRKQQRFAHRNSTLNIGNIDMGRSKWQLGLWVRFLFVFCFRLRFPVKKLIFNFKSFFLEKQMITFFLHYMEQKYGRFICVQLLQTLNILFENIRHETSLCKKLIIYLFIDFNQLLNKQKNDVLSKIFYCQTIT